MSELAEYIVDLDATPFCPDCWVVESHQKGGQWKYDGTKVSLYLSEGQKNGARLLGTKLCVELESQPTANANLLDFYLAHPHLIPEDCKGKTVFFWRTVYRCREVLYIRCLSCRSGRWDWSYCCLIGGIWSDDSPAVLLGK